MEDLNISELIAKPLFAEGGIGDRLFKAYHAYAEDYVLGTDGPDYAPTEFERELIEDFINGLFSDEQFLAPILALLSSAEAREEAERNAQGWHRAVEAICTIAGVSCALGASEAVEAVRAALQSAEARAQAAEARVAFLERKLGEIADAPMSSKEALVRHARQALGASHG